MAFRTPDEYLESIRDGRVVYLDGDVVEDVTTDPRTRDSAQSAADEFNRYHDPKVKDIFVMKDPETGEETDRFLMMPKSTEDLKARARAIDFAQETGMGRLGFLSDGMLAMRWVAPELGKTNPDYANAIETQFQRMRSENLLACIAMSDTKGDRSKHPGEQTDPDLYVRKVDEMPDGIVIRGMKAHISAAHLVNEMVVMPTKRMRDDEPEYSVCCLVSPGMEGVKLVARYDEPKNQYDYPLSYKGGAGESFIWLDDVFVPRDRIFQNGENHLSGPIAYALGLWQRYSAMCYKRHSIRMLAGAASLMAKYNGIESATHIQDKLFEIAMLADSLEAFIDAAAETAQVRDGVAVPNESITNIGKYMFASKYHELIKHVQDISGGILVTAPWQRDFENEDLHGAFTKYLSGGEKSTSDQRLRLLNFIRDLTADEYGGKQMVTSLHAEGSLVAQKMMTLRGYDFVSAEDEVKTIAGISD